MTMRKPVFCVNTEIIDTMTSNQQNNESGESRIERMRKFLSSPLTRKRAPVNHTNSRVFGTPLEILIQKNSTEASVPYIITRICQYIEKSGLQQEGLFRISGNARLIERLKASFDQSGDAPLETEGDVASAAALLKLFLRELPDPLIPSSMHQSFLNAAKTDGQSKEECIKQLKSLVQRLPLANHNVLQYLSYFLVSVSHHEEENRMNASALGIVFGPNLFRVAEDFKGLKEQSLTNQIVTYLISDYHAVFDSDIEYSSSRIDTIGEQQQLISLNNNACLGLPSSTLHTQKTNLYSPCIGHVSDLDSLSVVIPSIDNALLMIHSNKESLPERQPPFLMVNSLVEETINRTITEHLFGDEKNSAIGNNDTPKHFRRKRKDRKLSEKDHPNVCDVADKSIRYNETALPMDQLSTDSHTDDLNGFQTVDKHDTNQKIIRNYTTENIHSLSIESLVSHDSRILSPRPPKPKRREIESLSNSEPILDPHIVLTADDVDFHEAQRTIERFSPRSPVRSQLTTRSKYQKTSIFSNMKDDNEAQKENRTQLALQNHGTDMWNSTDQQSPYKEAKVCCGNFSKEHTENVTIGTSTTRIVSDVDSSATSMEDSFIKVSPSDLPLDHLDLLAITQEYAEGKTEFLRSDKCHEYLSDAEERKFDLQSDDVMQESISSECSTSDFSNIEQSSNEHRFSWPVLKSVPCRDTISVCPNHLRKTSSFEATLSPSACKSYLSNRSEHFDPNLPPSPPVEQEVFVQSSCKSDETVTLQIKFLTKKIHSLKKKIKQFDETYEGTHGYRPSHAEKMNYPDMKKVISELNKTRKELKYLKEEDVIGISIESNISQHSEPCVCSELPNTKSTTTSKVGENHGIVSRDGKKKDTVEDSLKETLKNLSDKRHLAERPEELEAMTKEQVVEEKVAIQKALLHFESVYGRPTSKTDRDLMRPLYDRYRNIKRIISKSGCQSSGTSKGKEALAELQPILEHVAMDFKTSEHRRETEKMPSSPVAGTSQNLSVTDRPNDISELEKEDEMQLENNAKLKNVSPESKYTSNLHELSLPELIRQQQYAKMEKHRLRHALREFEEQFQKQTGRKLQKEDRIPMDATYVKYKHMKAHLKLLEALLSKHEQHLI